MTTIDSTAYSIAEERARLNAMRVTQARNYLRTSRQLTRDGRLLDADRWRTKALELLDTVRFSLETYPP